MTARKLWFVRRWQPCVAIAGVASLVLALRAEAQAPSQRSARADSPKTEQLIAPGKQYFEDSCAECHGLDGRGSERAPDIATRPIVQQRSDAKLSQIIRVGVPSAGMPPFATLDEGSMKSLVAYLRLLQGKEGGTQVSGNSHNGEVIFFGKGRCSECHMVRGKGGFIGSDLSAFAAGRSANEIRDAILKPSRENPRDGITVVGTRNGDKFTGVVRNEDNFSLQLQGLDGTFHFFRKSDIESILRQPGTLMPTDYGAWLAPQEVNDLIAFLMTVARNEKSPLSDKKFRGDEEND